MFRQRQQYHFLYTEKLESEVPSEYVVNDTSVDLSTYTPDQPMVYIHLLQQNLKLKLEKQMIWKV